MTRIIIELTLLTLPFVAALELYSCTRPFMAMFSMELMLNVSARKLYVLCLLLLLLLYHYVHAAGHPGEWGVMLSAIPCAALFSYRRADSWLVTLHCSRKGFVITGLTALAICAIPHLYTTAVTLAFLLPAAMYYPPCTVTSGRGDKETDELQEENGGEISERGQ